MGKSVLLITSDPASASGLRDALSLAGYTVRAAPSADSHQGPLVATQDTPLEALVPTLEAVERQHIESVLDLTGYNFSKTSRLLAIDRTTLYNKIRRYGIGQDVLKLRRKATRRPSATDQGSSAD